MVPTDDHPGAPVVLPEGGVEQGFPRTGIAHVKRIAALENVFFNKVALDEGIDAFYANLGRDVAGLEISHQGMNEDAVTNLHGNLAQILMRSVHGVPELQGRDLAPASFLEDLPGLGRPHVDALVFGRVFGFA